MVGRWSPSRQLVGRDAFGNKYYREIDGSGASLSATL